MALASNVKTQWSRARMAQSACLSHAWHCVLEGQALAAHSVTVPSS